MNGIEISGIALIRIEPNKDLHLLALIDEITRILAWANTRTIATDDAVIKATEDLSLISNLSKAIEERRKEYTTPINGYLKQINDCFKLVTLPLNQADKITRGKILAYRQEQERKAREIEEINRLRMEAAQKEATLNNGEISEPVQLIETPPPPITHVRTDAGTLGTAKTRKWEVVDLKLVPDDYKILDAGKVGKVVRAGIPSIPGIRIYEKETLRITPK